MKCCLSVTIVVGLIVCVQSTGPVAQMEPVESVESVFNLLQSGIEDVIELAFDELDMALLTAAIELRATLNSLRTHFQDASTTAIDELDGQQRRLISDLKRLNEAMGTNLQDFATELRAGSNEMLTDIRLLVSDHAGAVYVYVKPVTVAA